MVLYLLDHDCQKTLFEHAADAAYIMAQFRDPVAMAVPEVIVAQAQPSGLVFRPLYKKLKRNARTADSMRDVRDVSNHALPVAIVVHVEHFRQLAEREIPQVCRNALITQFLVAGSPYSAECADYAAGVTLVRPFAKLCKNLLEDSLVEFFLFAQRNLGFLGESVMVMVVQVSLEPENLVLVVAEFEFPKPDFLRCCELTALFEVVTIGSEE